MVRGLVGIEVVSLGVVNIIPLSQDTFVENLHRVSSEEGLEVPLSGRVGEVPYVEATTFGRCSNNGFVLCSVNGLATSHVVGSLRSNRGDGGGGHVVGECVDGRHCIT